jgi:3',5'-cyclic AMP phosphodiesterase CpdA
MRGRGRSAATLDSYGQDPINSLLQSYADPVFHGAVQVIAREDERLFPMVVVPGNHDEAPRPAQRPRIPAFAEPPVRARAPTSRAHPYPGTLL